jgi:protein-S-isoprenylcysteine O-methyltransferase Ste14
MEVNGGTPGDNSTQRTNTRVGVRRWLSKQVFFLLTLVALLFISAGRLDWVWGWVQVGLYVVVVAAQALLLIPRQPELIAERSGYQKGSKSWDVVIAGLAAAILPMITWVLAGLDVRGTWSPALPVWLHLLAAVVWLLGYGLTIWAMTANPFFGTMVRIQDERGHTVAMGGPYRYVRHPGYVGAILFQLVTPILLGSLWALLPSVVAAALYVVRTALEDQTLQRDLTGYREYTAQVRYRLFPGVW